MRPRLRPVQLAAIRAVYEGDRPTLERLAAAVDVSLSTLRHRAWRESWKKMDYSRQGSQADQSEGKGGVDVIPPEWLEPSEEMSLEDLRQRFIELLPRQLAAILQLAERGIVDNTRIDGLVSMHRMVERSEALAGKQAQEKQKRSDDELAAMLGRIDDRIVELAEAYAEELVGSKDRE